jgi:hypothetical protein
MLLKSSPSVGPERKWLAMSLHLTFSLNSKMVQLAEPCPIFVIKNIMYITVQTTKKNLTAIA